jgi:hypothetical protein
VPTFEQPRKIEIVLYDDQGNKRIAVAQRAHGRSASLAHWDLVLGHPSGRTWPASFDGNAVLDAMGALIEQKDNEYHTQRGRSQMLPDRNVPVDEAGALMRQNITTHSGQQVAFGKAAVAFGKAAAAAARARSQGED